MPSFIDMTGWIMKDHGQPDSRLTVIKRGPNIYTSGGHSIVRWLCECSCENHTQFYVKSNNLRNGNTKSCGCLKKELIAKRNAENSSVKIGNKYGKLTVIKDLGMRQQISRNKNERWSLCQCDCGSNPIEVKNNLLQNGWKKSCGCLTSQGEFVIEQLLKEHNVSYLKEYKFKDLCVKEGFPLRFDFAIFDDCELNYLIEFDGRQHYTGPEATWKNCHSLDEIKRYDKVKNQWCKEHNIPLIRIPYTHCDKLNINDLILETSTFILDEEPVYSEQTTSSNVYETKGRTINLNVVPVDHPRCHKCVFDINTCGSSDYSGECKIYKRDPPDGGFYG